MDRRAKARLRSARVLRWRLISFCDLLITRGGLRCHRRCAAPSTLHVVPADRARRYSVHRIRCQSEHHDLVQEYEELRAGWRGHPRQFRRPVYRTLNRLSLIRSKVPCMPVSPIPPECHAGARGRRHRAPAIPNTLRTHHEPTKRTVAPRRVSLSDRASHRRVASSGQSRGCGARLSPLRPAGASRRSGEIRSDLPRGWLGNAWRQCRLPEPHRTQLRRAVRAAHLALGPGLRHRANRPRRHGVDDLQRAVSHSTQVRVARSHQRRTSGVESG